MIGNVWLFLDRVERLLPSSFYVPCFWKCLWNHLNRAHGSLSNTYKAFRTSKYLENDDRDSKGCSTLNSILWSTRCPGSIYLKDLTLQNRIPWCAKIAVAKGRAKCRKKQTDRARLEAAERRAHTQWPRSMTRTFECVRVSVNVRARSLIHCVQWAGFVLAKEEILVYCKIYANELRKIF